jgi:hypothetical protein
MYKNVRIRKKYLGGSISEFVSNMKSNIVCALGATFFHPEF